MANNAINIADILLTFTKIFLLIFFPNFEKTNTITAFSTNEAKHPPKIADMILQVVPVLIVCVKIIP